MEGDFSLRPLQKIEKKYITRSRRKTYISRVFYLFSIHLYPHMRREIKGNGYTPHDVGVVPKDHELVGT